MPTLTRLCDYYLHCLGLDNSAGVSVKARSQPPAYVELTVLPQCDPEQRALNVFPSVAAFFQRLLNGAGSDAAYLGYPVRCQWDRDANSWMLEPVFLFEFVRGMAEPTLSGDPPVINIRVIKAFAAGDATHVMEEAAALAEQLSPDGAVQPDIVELMARLRDFRPEWDWQEAMNPAALSVGASLADIHQRGIFNRAVIFSCEGSKYTKGLEQELVKLRSIPDYAATALGSWVTGDFSAFNPMSPDDAELLEPLPLNSEQREAVEKSLTRPLTVITGPPGTGKSQVVSAILLNAARRGMRVLFTSKNHKAVDVVEQRVNELGPRPILLRLGDNNHKAAISDYLTKLLASTATLADTQDHGEAMADYTTVVEQLRQIQMRASKVVALRNAVDAAEQKVEQLRNELGEVWFQDFRKLDAEELRNRAVVLAAAVESADRNRQPFFMRLFWGLHRQARIKALAMVATDSLESLHKAKIKPPKLSTTDADVAEWRATASILLNRAYQVREITRYDRLLGELSSGDRIEALWNLLFRLAADSAQLSMRVWDSWLRLSPSRLKQQHRLALGEFVSILELMAQCESGPMAQLFRNYYRLFPQIAGQLPCWAVTSLSARGRVPFEAGFFDLLVVDEASQCDIASILPLLYRAKAAVIIGDPMQLRHISTISRAHDTQLLAQHGLMGTHLNWAFSVNSVFALATRLTLADDIITLRDHHRSHAAIIGFSNKHFYDGKLRVATKYDRLNRPTDQPAIRWIHIRGTVVNPGSGAMIEAEAQAVVREIERIMITLQFQGSIGVVTPFRAQANRIRQILHDHPQGEAMRGHGELLVETVHKFQGDERDVMIFSPVISNGMPQGAEQFLRASGNLFNVAITRARASLIVVGDRDAARASNIPHLSHFAAYVTDYKAPIPSVPVADLGPVFPTVAHPERVSDWERYFYAQLYLAGFRPIPQYDVEKYTLDFAIIQGNRSLNIEVDGERYHRDWNGELLRDDQLRNTRLIELGWDVMRFWVYEIRDDIDGCLSRVAEWANKR